MISTVPMLIHWDDDGCICWKLIYAKKENDSAVSTTLVSLKNGRSEFIYFTSPLLLCPGSIIPDLVAYGLAVIAGECDRSSNRCF
jgi:hypothetical protein